MIEKKANKNGFVPVPEKTFAEAMYEICLQQSEQQKANEATANGTDGTKPDTKEQKPILSK